MGVKVHLVVLEASLKMDLVALEVGVVEIELSLKVVLMVLAELEARGASGEAEA